MVGGHFGEGVGGQEKKSIYESSLSVIIVHYFDYIKPRIPAEVVSYSSGNLWDSVGIPEEWLWNSGEIHQAKLDINLDGLSLEFHCVSSEIPAETRWKSYRDSSRKHWNCDGFLHWDSTIIFSWATCLVVSHNDSVFLFWQL